MLNRRDRAKARREIDNIVELRPRQFPIVSWKANIPLMVLAYILFLLTLGVNATVAWDKGTTIIDKGIMASLGAVFEAMLFFLPSQATSLWIQHRFVSSIFACILSAFLFVSALLGSLAFASLNLTDTTTVRAERITPAVFDAQRKLDGLSSYRDAECVRVGDKCRQAVKDVQVASQALTEARQAVLATADPQIASAAKLVSWVSADRFHLSADDFAMLRLFLLTILPQLGGLVLMVAKRA